MPELPDVETYKRYLQARALHQRIERIQVQAPALLKGTTAQALGRALKGRTFESACRHGKYLLVELDHGGWLVLHFGMTGELRYARRREERPGQSECLIVFDNGSSLAYIAPRKLGRITLTDSPQTLAHDRKLGPDALDLSGAQFRELATHRRGTVKAWLMNQQIMSGIGNVYSDEILFQAGIHPQRSVAALDDDELKQLYKALRAVLNTAVKKKADPEKMPADFLLPQRHKGGRCPKCGTALRAIKTGGRSAWYCPRHQRT